MVKDKKVRRENGRGAYSKHCLKQRGQSDTHPTIIRMLMKSNLYLYSHGSSMSSISNWQFGGTLSMSVREGTIKLNAWDVVQSWLDGT